MRVDDFFVMLLRAGINRRHDQSGLRKRKLVTGDMAMAERDDGLNRRKVRIGRLVETHMALICGKATTWFIGCRL